MNLLQTGTSPPGKVNVPVVMMTLIVSIYLLRLSPGAAGGLQGCLSARHLKTCILLNGVWCKCHFLKGFWKSFRLLAGQTGIRYQWLERAEYSTQVQHLIIQVMLYFTTSDTATGVNIQHVMWLHLSDNIILPS